MIIGDNLRVNLLFGLYYAFTMTFVLEIRNSS